MDKRSIIFVSRLLVAISIIFWSCTKLDTTTIGEELLPEVDNINTFADTLDIITTQGSFTGTFQDTTKLTKNENYIIGKVVDPLMGGTTAKLFLQFKPPYYPYFIGKIPKDTITQPDSVVLCLSYKDFWGDSTQPLQLQVFEVPTTQHGDWDSVQYIKTINYEPATGRPLSDIKTIDIRNLGAFTKVGIRDSVNNQIRIKLYQSFRDSLFARDTTTNKGLATDSAYRAFSNGFAIVCHSANALMYVNLIDQQTRLEFHYKKKNGGPVDTVFNSFYFNSGLSGEVVRLGAVANKITRSRNALPIGDQELYMQTTPGTYANLEIPGLTNYPNRIIHRAELQISAIPDPINNNIYAECKSMYLDLVDSGLNKWKPVYFDLNPSLPYDPDYKTAGIPYFPYNGEVNTNYFGGINKKRTTVSGTQSYYNINITRYVQQIATKHTTNYKMRLFPAQSFSYPQYSTFETIPYFNAIAYGSTKIGGGANPNPAYRMRLRIVYSKVK